MRLVVATPLYPPDSGGPATYAKLLEEGLPERGCDVSLVKFGEVRHLPKIIKHVAYFLNVRRAARDADLILALDPVSTGLPALMAAWSLKKPFSVKVVGDYAWEQGLQRYGITEQLDEFLKREHVPLPVAFLRFVEGFVARRARVVIVPSAYLKGVVAQWGVPMDRIVVVYNAVPQVEPAALPTEYAALARPLIVSAGRLVPWKKMEGVMDAAALLKRDGLAASLIIVGDGPERAHLRQYAKAVFPETVFTGALPNAEALAVVASADAFVLNSSYEGLSHFLIEAAMLGAPTVATDAGGNKEVITHNETGLLVPVGDTELLARSIRRLFDANEARRFTEAARVVSRERFSLSAMLDGALAALSRALV